MTTEHRERSRALREALYRMAVDQVAMAAIDAAHLIDDDLVFGVDNGTAQTLCDAARDRVQRLREEA